MLAPLVAVGPPLTPGDRKVNAGRAMVLAAPKRSTTSSATSHATFNDGNTSR